MKSVGMFEIETATSQEVLGRARRDDLRRDQRDGVRHYELLLIQHSVPQLDFLQSNNNDVMRTLAHDSGDFAYPSISLIIRQSPHNVPL